MKAAVSLIFKISLKFVNVTKLTSQKSPMIIKVITIQFLVIKLNKANIVRPFQDNLYLLSNKPW